MTVKFYKASYFFLYADIEKISRENQVKLLSLVAGCHYYGITIYLSVAHLLKMFFQRFQYLRTLFPQKLNIEKFCVLLLR